MSEPLLRVERLAKTFVTGDRRIDVLRGVDLEVQEGESLAILGQSGVGKSTLLHLLGALDRPSEGRIWFRGRDLAQESPEDLVRFRNQRLGFVFQFHHLLPEFSAVENVMMPGLLGGRSFEEMRARATALLEEVGLAERLDHPVGKLSGGERQRVALARALVLEPDLVLADEPTGNLDPGTGGRVADLLLEMNRARGTALLVVTHDESFSSRLGRRLTLVEGRL
jgi:lipoprotein-releasing system ATP-binding protein